MQNTDFVASQKNDFDEEMGTADMSKRRRTVDNEGFVTPTTPDIPKSSIFYKCQEGGDHYTPATSDGDEFFDDDFFTSYQSFTSPGTQEKPSFTEPESEDDPSTLEPGYTSHDKPTDESSRLSPPSEVTLPCPGPDDDDSEREDSQASSPNIYDDLSIADIIKDMSEKSMKVYMHWMDLFRDGERFEEGVPSLIDELLNQARQIEHGLVKQKEALRQRISRVTQTLRTDHL